jgi:hypothetical protein
MSKRKIDSLLKKNFSLVVISCDKFYDTWSPVAYSFQKYWPDCPVKRYLLTNNKNFKSKFFINKRVGNDKDWSTNLKKFLKKIKTKYVILWLDDVFLTNQVDTEKVKKDLLWSIKMNIDYLQLTNLYSYKTFLPEYFLIEKNHPYRTSIFSSIWRKVVLKKIINPGENAWEFELKGSSRSNKYKNFYSVNCDRFRYLHAIEKGKWLRNAIDWLKKENFDINLNYRKRASKIQTIARKINLLKSFILNLFSGKQQKRILLIAERFYLFFRLRNKNYYITKY